MVAETSAGVVAAEKITVEPPSKMVIVVVDIEMPLEAGSVLTPTVVLETGTLLVLMPGAEGVEGSRTLTSEVGGT